MISQDEVKQELQKIVSEYGMDYYGENHFPKTKQYLDQQVEKDLEIKRLREFKATFDAYELSKKQDFIAYENWQECEKILKKVEKYAKHLAKKYPEYATQQYTGKNGADSIEEKNFWRGMTQAVLAFLLDLKRASIIEHTGLDGDDWPEEDPNGKDIHSI